MDLIVQLKQQHVEILHFFKAIGDEMAKGDVEDNYLIEELNNLKDFLIAHLALEDRMLYPSFEMSKFKEAQNLGKKFSTEMTAISKVAMIFFEKYNNMILSDLLKNAKFKKEADLIITTVKRRVGIEESILYPAYDKYCRK
ncbi:MAG: hemerythrin domain-containing protein [Nanoarchaeota archaeon]